MRSTIIAIHGVGDAQPGEIAKALEALLAPLTVDAEIHEINWNSIVAKPVEDEKILKKALLELARALAWGSVVQNSGSSSRGIVSSVVNAISDASFAASEIAMAGAFAMLVWGIPLLILLSFTTSDIPQAVQIGPSAALPLLNWAFKAFLISGVTFACASLLARVLEKHNGGLWVTVRRMTLMCMRPLIILGYAIFLFRWSMFWKTILRVPPYWLLLGAISLLSAIAAQPSLGDALKAIGTLVSGAVLLYVITRAFVFLMRALVGPSIKVFLDIFRYLCDLGYRNKLLEFFAGEAQKIIGRDKDRDFFIVGHSLGSVIALDCLINSPVWDRAGCVTLITMGSPLQRFFFRFFPSMYFPPNVRECERAVRTKSFRWLNCYRPLDYVGARVGRRNTPWHREIAVRQGMCFHTKYWDDSDVLAKVHGELPFVGTLDKERNGDSYMWMPQEEKTLGHRAVAHRLIATLLLFTAIALPLFVLGNVIAGETLQFKMRVARNNATVAAQLKTDAEVTYRVTTIARSEMPERYWDLKFKFRGVDGRFHEWSTHVEGGFSTLLSGPGEDGWRFDYSLLGHLTRECHTTCSVQILLNPQENDYFVAADYVPHYKTSDLIVWSATDVLVDLVLIGLFLLGCRVTAPAFKALLGDVRGGPRNTRAVVLEPWNMQSSQIFRSDSCRK